MKNSKKELPARDKVVRREHYYPDKMTITTQEYHKILDDLGDSIKSYDFHASGGIVVTYEKPETDFEYYLRLKSIIREDLQ